MFFQGLQVRKQSESNPLYDPTDDPKKFDFQANFKPDTPLPGTPGTSSWSPETPLGHRTGPKPDFHRFLVSFWRSGCRPWGPFWRPWDTCGRQLLPKDSPQTSKMRPKIDENLAWGPYSGQEGSPGLNLRSRGCPGGGLGPNWIQKHRKIIIIF